MLALPSVLSHVVAGTIHIYTYACREPHRTSIDRVLLYFCLNSLQGALFESPHEDENDVQTISHKCEVLALDAYTTKFGDSPKKYRLIYDNNDTYYKAGFYDPTTMKIKMEPDIPVLPNDEKWL